MTMRRNRGAHRSIVVAVLAAGVLLLSGCSPQLQWSAPAPIVQWRPLSAAQLDATSTTPGRYFYEPGLGAQLAAGTHTLHLTMLPDDPAHPALQPAHASHTIQVTPPPTATGGLAGRQDLEFGSVPTGSAVGDLNNDGLPDLVVLSWSTVGVWMGTGPGTFGAFTLYQGPPFDTGAVALADLNGDGHLDVVATGQWENSLAVMLGDGSGALGDLVNYPVAAGPMGVKAVDLNHDAIPDLVTTGSWDHRVSVLLGNGDGTFGPSRSFDTNSSPFGLDVGDLDGDGNLDLVVANNYAFGALSVLRGDGAGGFGPQTVYDVGPSGYPAFGVALGDLNRDGHLDVVISIRGDTYSSPVFPANVRVLLGTGTGTFGPASGAMLAPGNDPMAVAVADMNGDGILDIVNANRDAGSISVRLGTGLGTFLPRVDVATPSGAFMFTVADLNGDHRPDVLVPDAESSAATMLFGQPRPS